MPAILSRQALPTIASHNLTDSVVYEGQTKKWRVIAARGNGLRYQWQVNSGSGWSDISGATSANYTTAATVRATDSGKVYRCIIRNGAGRVVSPEATLTVWSPLDLGASLACWLDPSQGIFTERTGASATTATADGEVVGTWRARNGTINGTAATDAQRPIYRATGLYGQPGIEFDGVNDALDFTASLAATFNDKSYGYIFYGGRATNEASGHNVINFTNNSTSARATLYLNFSSTTGLMLASGRRLDSDSAELVQVSSATVDDEVIVCGGEFLWAEATLHLRKNKVRIGSDETWLTAGNTSATNSAGVFVGATSNSLNFFDGIIGNVVVCNAQLTAAEIDHIESFIMWKQGQPVLDWNLNSRTTGVLSAVTVKNTTLVCAPNGDTPTENDMLTHRYRHPTQIIVHGGRTHIFYDCSGTNEHGGGGQNAYVYSDDKGVTWSAPLQLFPAQSTWTAAAVAYAAGSHVVTVRKWVVLGDRLFATAVIFLADGTALSDQGSTAVAMIAREVFPNATFGDAFRISPEDYTALDSKPKLDYDSNLGPRLFPEANIFGEFGGTATGYTGIELDGFPYQGSDGFFEKRTIIPDPTDPERLTRNLRSMVLQVPFVYQSESIDSGATFGLFRKTNVPNGPSPTAFLRLADGRFAIAGNVTAARTELYLAMLNSEYQVQSIGYIKTGVSTTPTYAGTFKGNGCAYPHMVQRGNYLYVSWSEQKESIYFGRVLIPGLADNNNDG
jgi:hypothetical protein